MFGETKILVEILLHVAYLVALYITITARITIIVINETTNTYQQHGRQQRQQTSKDQ